MMIKKVLKKIGIVPLVLSVAIGCAKKQEDTGPDPAEVASQAIAAAQAAIDEAAALGADTSDAEGLLSDARAAYDGGNYESATSLANQAERAARDAIAKYNAELLAKQRAAELEATKRASSSSYEVSRGDSLWRIAGKSSVYGNAYQWPLIYKANKSKIKDADLIYPGQVFDIQSSPSSSDVEAAINHAKTRGAWSVGPVEASDEAYLAR